MKTTKILAAALFATLSTAAVAHEEEGGAYAKAIDYRNSVMSIFKWNMGPMAKMVKGEAPYDQVAFARHAKDLAAAAQLDLLSGFPEDSNEGDDTSARSDIWMDWDSFLEKYGALKKASSELAQTADGGNLEAVKPKFGALGKSCKSCHDAFKD